MQWADAGTLQLLGPVYSSSSVSHFLLILSFRESEVKADHPFSVALRAMEAKRPLQAIVLGSLEQADFAGLLGDTLRQPVEVTTPLAQLLLAKTGGNPFFAGLFLRTLYERGLFAFDPRTLCWTFELERISRLPVADNVVVFLQEQLDRFPEEMQDVLLVAACAGNSFDSALIAAAMGQSQDALARSLATWENAGFIVWTGQEYSFAHDRVQQTALGRVSLQEAAAFHLRLGQYLKSSYATRPSDEMLFRIVHHLNMAKELLPDEEREEAASLSAAAGRKAAETSAWRAALGYCGHAAELLEDNWGMHRKLLFQLHLTIAASQYSLGHLADAEQTCVSLLPHGKTPKEVAEVVWWQKSILEASGRVPEAVQCIIQGLYAIGAEFPQDPVEIKAALVADIAKIKTLLGDRSIEDLADTLPLLDDETKVSLMSLMGAAAVPIQLAGIPDFANLVVATMARYSLESGVCGDSALGFLLYGVVFAHREQDFSAGFAYGQLGLRLAERFDKPLATGATRSCFAIGCNYFHESFADCAWFLRDVVNLNRTNGDLVFATYGALFEFWFRLLSSNSLEPVASERLQAFDWIHQSGFPVFPETVASQLHMVRALQGANDHVLDPAFDTASFEATFASTPTAWVQYVVEQAFRAYLFEQFDDAVRILQSQRELVDRYRVMSLVGIFALLIEALSKAALVTTADIATLAELRKAQSYLARMAESAPHNFLCWALLIEAEIVRLERAPFDALHLLKQAAETCTQYPSLFNQAVVAETSARTWLQAGDRLVADAYFSRARKDLLHMGCKCKSQSHYREVPEGRASHKRSGYRDLWSRQVERYQAIWSWVSCWISCWSLRWRMPVPAADYFFAMTR